MLFDLFRITVNINGRKSSTTSNIHSDRTMSKYFSESGSYIPILMNKEKNIGIFFKIGFMCYSNNRFDLYIDHNEINQFAIKKISILLKLKEIRISLHPNNDIVFFYY